MSGLILFAVTAVHSDLKLFEFHLHKFFAVAAGFYVLSHVNAHNVMQSDFPGLPPVVGSDLIPDSARFSAVLC